jgi:hypothetical protein
MQGDEGTAAVMRGCKNCVLAALSICHNVMNEEDIRAEDVMNYVIML